MNKELVNKKIADMLAITTPWGYDILPTALYRVLMSIFGTTLSMLSYYNILMIRNKMQDSETPLDIEVEMHLDDTEDSLRKECREKAQGIDVIKTRENIIRYLTDKNIEHIEFRYLQETVIIFDNTGIILRPNDTTFIIDGYDIPQWIEDAIAQKPKNEKNTYKYVIHTPQGFDTRFLKIKNYDVDVNGNYNDDLPDSQIKSFLQGTESGIVILHGEPGTGKSTYIRHLISNVKKTFLYLDISCFDNLTNSSFLELLLNNKDSIIILEDSEQLLKKRENSKVNIANLLNLTDGLLADTLNLKFICTFNAKLTDIDEALLRKGRLKVKYKFDKLEIDKTAKLFDKLNIEVKELTPMTLAEIYNFVDKVDYEKKASKIGF